MSMSYVNLDKYPCFLSFKVLDTYHFILLEKGPMTESVVFFHEHYVLSVLPLKLVNVHILPKMCHIKVVLHPIWPFRVMITIQPFLSFLFIIFCIF